MVTSWFSWHSSKIATHNGLRSISTILWENRGLWTVYTVQYCFLFRFVCIKLVSLIWFLQIWVAIYVYGALINWSKKIKNNKKINANVYCHSLWSVLKVKTSLTWWLVVVWCSPSRGTNLCSLQDSFHLLYRVASLNKSLRADVCKYRPEVGKINLLKNQKKIM